MMLFLSMLKKLYILFIVLFLLGQHCPAQYWDWAKQSTGGTGNGVQSASDGKGNLFVILDAFAGSIGYGTQTFTAETVLAKHDATGIILWAYALNGIRSYAISSDTSGNVCVAGGAWNGAVLHSSVNSATITSMGGFDAFLAKYNSLGNLIWVRTWGDTISNDNATTLKTDALGNSYISGWESYTSYHPYTHTEVKYFVVKYDSSGNLIWSNISSWSNNAQPYASDLDINGNYYITGNIYSNVSFGTTTVTVNSSNYTIFIVKYDKNGNVVWAKTDGTNYDESRGISVDNKGYFYLNGFYANPSTFGTTTLNGPAPGGMFIVKYDTAGNAIWAKREGVKYGRGVACDSSGFFIVGVFQPPYNSPPPSTGTLGIGSNSVFFNSSKGEFFIAKYDDNGNLKWGIQPGGNTGQADWSNHICSDKKGNCYVVGNFEGTTICGNTTLYSPYTSIYYEAFEIKLKVSKISKTSIKNISSAKSNLVVSPNPTGSVFNIIYNAESGGTITLKICDAVGKCFYSTIYKNFNGEINETIDLSSFAKGMYIIEVVGTRTKETKKLVLQ